MQSKIKKAKTTVDVLLENWAHWHMQTKSPVPSIALMKYKPIKGLYEAEDEQEAMALKFAVNVADAEWLNTLLAQWQERANTEKWVRAVIIKHRYSAGFELSAEDTALSVSKQTGKRYSIEFINSNTSQGRGIISARYETALR